MNTKLTLSIEKKTIERAKKYALSQKTSISKLVENYLDLITRSDNSGENKVEEPATPYANSPLVQKMRGLLQESEIRENDRLEYLKNKYL